MASTKDEKQKDTKDTKVTSESDQLDTKAEQSEPKSEQKNADTAQNGTKAEQTSTKTEQTGTKTEQAETTVSSNSSTGSSESISGTVPLGTSSTEPVGSGSTGQALTTNKEVANMADKIITKGSDGKFDYSNSRTYRTVKGDTLFGVAQEHGVAMQQLRYYNGLRKGIEQLPVGIDIHIPNGYVDVPLGE